MDDFVVDREAKRVKYYIGTKIQDICKSSKRSNRNSDD
jgi:hypothetical protein